LQHDKCCTAQLYRREPGLRRCSWPNKQVIRINLPATASALLTTITPATKRPGFMTNREVVVLSAVRTPIGQFGGALKDIPPSELAGKVVCHSLQRSGLPAADIGHVVFGNVTMCIGGGQGIAAIFEAMN
jgi:hypothetical protein